MLAVIPGLQVVGEAMDGMEAVQKARRLKPDLVLLDIGLPELNGLDAARKIRRHDPGIKILILSQESSSDVVREAWKIGVRGYVLKAHAGTELLPAVEAVIRGERFLSSNLGVDSTGARGAEICGSHLMVKG
jgi:DNA-binding NarL/FixJ family response regulator